MLKLNNKITYPIGIDENEMIDLKMSIGVYCLSEYNLLTLA